MIGVGYRDGRTRYPQIRQQGLWVNIFSQVHMDSNVGASLLAKASDQSTYVSTDNPLSRAGSLPQGVQSLEEGVASERRLLRSVV